jgi:tRNA1(Val) A37 N6-methylase TrmN6
MELIHELLGYEHIKIIQNPEMFSFSLDSILLANFVDTNPKTKKIMDLGCGNAPIPLFLSLKTKADIIGVEIQPDVADMAIRSVELNGLEKQIKIINTDFKDIYKNEFTNAFDIVTSNPPYFKYKPDGNINKNDYLTIARHEIKATLEDVVSEAKKLLIDGGSFYMVHRAERLAEIVQEVAKNNFAIKKMQFVYTKASSKEALLVLLEAKKNRLEGMKVIEPLYVYEDNGEYSEKIKKIFNFKKTH